MIGSVDGDAETMMTVQDADGDDASRQGVRVP
jgi:hypothetical protein